MKRIFMALPVLAVAAACFPVSAAAGTTTEAQLKLSPASGPSGSHFTAIFTYSVTRCDFYSVGLWWDDPNYTRPLGVGSDTTTGQSCQVSIDAVVPADHAVVGTTYPVHAYASPRNASLGGGPGPSGSAAYTVTAASTADHASAGTASAHSSQPAAPTGRSSVPPAVVAQAPPGGGIETSQGAAGAATSAGSVASDGQPSTTPPVDIPIVGHSTGSTSTPRWVWAAGASLLLLAGVLVWRTRWGPLRRVSRR